MDLRHMSCLRQLEIDSSELTNLYLPVSLEVLKIDEDSRFLGDSMGCVSAWSYPPLENLKTLFCHVETPLPDFLLQAAEKTKPGQLENCEFLENFGMGTRFLRLLESGWLKEIKYLWMDGSNINDAHSQLLIDNCPNLRHLNIDCGGGITGCFVLDLIKSPACKLETVHISCERNDFREVGRWAKPQGVEVVVVPF